ncbi:sensor domain-containing diguanylate cyclase [Xanthomonas sp. F4]
MAAVRSTPDGTMGMLGRYLFYFFACALINYLALLEQSAVGLIFFWPGNALGALLALHWRSRDRRGAPLRHGAFLLLFFAGHYATSLLVPQPMTPQQQFWACLFDTLHVASYGIAMRLVVRHRHWFAPYRRTALLIAPVLLSVLASGACVGLLLNRLVPLGTTGFVVIDWISEQFLTCLVVTLIFHGGVRSNWSAERRRHDRPAVLLIAALVLAQLMLTFSPWLTITSIAAIPALVALARFDFKGTVLVTGLCMTLPTLSRVHFYVVTNNYQKSANFYQEIFAHRIEFAIVAILVVFMAELLGQKHRLLVKTTYQAETDRLTRLYNRAFMVKAIDRLPPGSRLGLAVLDIDDFKKINDTYGHAVGDRILLMVSAVLQRSAHATGIAARWGGEEFLIALPDISMDDFLIACDRLVADVRSQPDERSSGLPQVTISLGGVHIERFERAAFEHAFSAADAQLYQAKREGKDRARLLRMQQVPALGG